MKTKQTYKHINAILAPTAQCVYGFTFQFRILLTVLVVISFLNEHTFSETFKFTRIKTFNNRNGSTPLAPLVASGNGKLYGTTFYGGPNGYGEVFSLNSSNVFAKIFSFNGNNGIYANSLIVGQNGMLYGTTHSGGGYGVIYRLTRQGVYKKLFAFNESNGAFPTAVVDGTDGYLYGTTEGDGGNGGEGTIFRITNQQEFKILVSFDVAPGAHPSSLIRGLDNAYYGATNVGGTAGNGILFRVTSAGDFSTVASIIGPNGNGFYTRVAPPIIAKDGNFYGVTRGGVNSDGSIYRVTSDGGVNTLVSFDDAGNGTGAFLDNPLIAASDGKLYGVATYGGAYGHGTIFRTKLTGGIEVLYSFNESDGASPSTALFEKAPGTFYGGLESGSYGGLYRFNMTQ